MISSSNKLRSSSSSRLVASNSSKAASSWSKFSVLIRSSASSDKISTTGSSDSIS
ncbi:hypothetical protein RUS48_03135 [Mycoplasmoides gallisepticum]|nr:hypothetical protein RUS48_03135 [Mycoplasmoides gallisepticum]